MNHMTCNQCGTTAGRVSTRHDDQPYCDPCYRAALAYGHLHADHDPAVEGCPLCEGEAIEDQRISQLLGVSLGDARRMGR